LVVLLWAEYSKGPKTIGPNAVWAENGQNQLARARFGPLELVSAIFIEVKCHSLLHSSGNKLRLAADDFH
jgi:hypothetical protein